MAAKDTPDKNIADVKMKVLQMVLDMDFKQESRPRLPWAAVKCGCECGYFFSFLSPFVLWVLSY
jgi:hypothetical protein